MAVSGEYDSLGDFAHDLHEETGTQIPDALSNYIDWDALGRDIELNGEVFTLEINFPKIHIFWSR